jgi:uncharacterized repeat protein (TIGR01451 family)
VSSTPSQGTYSSTTGVWTVGTVSTTIAPTLIIQAKVASPNAQTNTATISHTDQFDPNSANNQAKAIETPQQSDLALSKTVNDATPNVGDTITFTVTLTNNGPNAATNVQVSDLLPAGLTFVSATPSQGTYSGATGQWNVGTVAAGATPTLQIQVTVVSSSAETNSASIKHSDQFDPNTGNNSATATETPQQSDLALTKTVNDATPNVGDRVTFTVTLTNSGPDDATNVKVTDLLPAGLTYISSTPSQGSYDSVTGSWTVGKVSTTAAPTLQIQAMVVSPNSRTNTATIAHSDQFDPNSANNQAMATETPQQSDLALTKTVSNATPNVGDTVTFTVTLTNNGPNGATNVQVSDLLPAGLTFVSATPSQGTYSSTTGVWMAGTVAANAAPTLQIQAKVVSSSAQTNTAAINHSDQFDPNTGNNTTGVTETPQQSDLVVGKVVSDPTPNVGDTITYTVTVTNDGPDAATNVQVTDLLPAGLTFVFSTPSQGSYSSATGVWSVGAVATTATATLQIQARVVSSSAQTNAASISHSDQFDPNTGNNSGSVAETPQQSDLALTKTVDDATPNVGNTVTFTVTLANQGPDDATNVQVSDLLPPGLTYVSSSPSQGTYNSATGVWTVGTVATTIAPTLQIQAKVVSPSAQTNSATISHSDQFDPNTNNNSSSVTETPQQSDLALNKTVNDATPNVGDTVTFTVTLTNNGPDAATNVQVNDLLPAGLTFVSATPSQGAYNSGTGVWTVGSVASAAAPTLLIQAKVVSPSAQTNSATIAHSDQFDPNTGNNSTTATETPQQADLVVGKTVSNPKPNVGQIITYTVTVFNNGPDDATGVTLQDVLPTGVSYQSSTATAGSYNPATKTWTVGTVPFNVTETLTITVKVTSANAAANTASISHSDQFDPNTLNNSATAATNPQQADLMLTKVVNDPTPNVGDTVTFTVSLTNNGPSAATNVQVSDLLPAGLTFVSSTPSQGTYNNGTGVWTVGTVANAATQTLTLQATVVSSSAQTNTATISHSDQFDPNPGNNQGSATETPQQSDLVLTKTVNDATPNVGDTVTFTLTLSNNGPDTATNVTVQDLLPAGLTFVSSTPSQGTYNNTSGAWTVGTVTTTIPQTLTIQATVTSSTAATNTGAISHSDQFDPNTGNNSAGATETPQQSDLALTKTVSDAAPNVGDTVTFTVTLTNNGPDAATGVQVSDLLPTGLTFVSATPSQGSYSSGTGVWMVGTVSTTVAPTLQVRAKVVTSSAQTNTATIAHSDQFDPNPNNNNASATETPQQADLALSKTVNNTTPNVGDTITFTVTLSNKGPDPATNVTVADALPAGLNLVSATPSQGTYAAGVWTVGIVSPSTPQTLTITAKVVSSSAQTNTATISTSDQFDPNAGNNTTSATETPQQSDLSLAKTVSNATPNVGDTVTFTVTLTNLGPDPATGVQVSDLLPAGLTFVSSTPSQGSYNGGTGLWTVGTVTTTVSPTLQIQAKVVSSTTDTNTATIKHSDQFDPTSANNQASASESPQQSDLAVSKTVSDATPNVGDTVTFTITLTNNGPDTATNVQVSDLLPAGLTFVSATPSQGTYNSGTGVWTVGTVANAATQTLQIQAKVVSSSAATNTATIAHSDQFDPNTANNSGGVTETPQQSDLALTKTVNDTTPNVGDTVTFTITMTNKGPNPATNVTVADALPAGLTLISSSPSQGTYTGGVWTVGTVSPSAAPSLTITAKVVSSAAQTNTATIRHSDQFDPNSGNNQSSATETPQQSDLAVSKTVSNSTPNVGETVTFTVTLTNNGPDAATNVQVSDLLPAGLTFVSSTPSQGTYNNVSGVWTVGTVANAAAPTLQIQAKVVSPSAQANSAAISHSDQFDPNTGNNSAGATETPQQADLQVSKTVSNPTPNVNDIITYTITVSDNGPDSATGVTVQDLIPSGLSIVSATPSQGSYDHVSGAWIVGTVNPGTPQTLTISAKVISPNPASNTASISHSDQFDPDTANNSDSSSTNPEEADLALAKTVTNPTPNVNDTITFIVTLTNNGPNTATNVTVADALPSGLTLVTSAPSQGTYIGGVWTVGNVAASAAPTLTITATVDSSTPLTNTATISHSDQFDPDSGNNSASATETPQQSDLALTKTVSNATPNVNDTITFTVTLTNKGPDDATNVTVADALPAGLTLVGSSLSQGMYTGGVWTVGTVSPSVAQTLIITAHVDSQNALMNTATISHSDQFDPDKTNNNASVTETPQQSDLAMTKTVGDSTPNVGDTVTFTVTLTNNGPDAATNVAVNDLLPAGLTYVSSTPSQGMYDNVSGVWTVGTVANGAMPTLQIQTTVDSSTAKTNTATISHSDQFDPNKNNNTGTATETPQESDLTLTKMVSNKTPNVGNTITFTLTLSNTGPDDATNVEVSDLLPAGLTFVSSTPSQGTYNSGTGVWSVGTVTTATPQTLLVQAKVVSSSAQTNTATISHSDQFDPDPNNNTGTATETPQQSDLMLAKTVSNKTPNVGDTITFTVTMTNNGPDAATNVDVTDLLPTGLTYVGSTPSQGTYNSTSGVWMVGTVVAMAAPTLQIQATVVSSTAETNTATISHSDQFDPNTNNNSGSATETPQQSDVSLTKTVSNTTPNVNDTITFTITLTNQGPDAATNVTVADALPAGLTLVGSNPSQGTYTGGVWTVGTVSPSAAPTLTITAKVVSTTAATNAATISHSDQFDPDPGNNAAGATETPQQSDLVVGKSVSNSTPNVNDIITYTVTLTNDGPNTATNVQVTDQLPAGLSYVSSTPSQGTYDNISGVWMVGTVANAAAPTLQIQAKVVSAGPGTNMASVSHSDQFDSNTGNNSAIAPMTPQQSDLALTKTVSSTTPNVGDTITFTVTLNNKGPDPATNVTVADALPAGLTLVSSNPSQGTYTGGVWTVGTVSTAVAPTLTITAKVVSSSAQTNTAMISHSDQSDPNSGNNSAGVTETPQQSDLSLKKTVSNTAPNVGDTVTFTVTLTNVGPDTATDVTVSDALPAGLTLVGSNPSQGIYNSATGVWTVGTVTTAVAPTLILTAKVVSPKPTTNTATIHHSDQFDPITGNNTGSATVTPPVADLGLTKTVNKSQVMFGTNVTYTFTIHNLGPNTAHGVVVSDNLPRGLVFVSAPKPSQGTYNHVTGIWNVGALASGASATLRVTFRVMTMGPIVNTARATELEFDPFLANNIASATVIGLNPATIISKRLFLASTT